MSLRVLIVDDDPDIRLYLRMFLEDEGLEVSEASRAAEAMAEVGSDPPDVVLIDVMMPGRSGLDLLVSLRQHPRHRDLPLIVVTGNDRILEDDCQSYLGAHLGIRGPDGVLSKPVDRMALLAVVRSVSASSMS
jgi:CheY-like chemotaxis protein